MRTIVFLIGLILPSSVFAQVVISEVMWAGSERSTADEWLEIVNISDETVVLNGWTILKRGSDGSDTVMIAFPEDAEISAGQYFLIANYNAEQSDLNVSPDIVSTAVSLANSKLYLQLLDNEGEIIDSVDDGSGAPFAGGKDPFASMERINLSASGEDASNWKTAEVSVGFDVGMEVFGSPGVGTDVDEGTEGTDVLSNSSVPSSPSAPSVRITEVLLNPADSEDYEWIELGNLGEESVDITGWILSDGARSHAIEPRNNSGYILQPNEHTLFFHYQTGIALSNQGEVITLFDGDTEIDRIDVSETGEEISFGREPDGSRGPFCVPTPRKPNHENLLNPVITVQSGRSTDYVKVTLNVEAEVSEGSLKDAECFWDFKDATISKKCNPPSHTWDYYGVYNVELLVTTKCGDEIKKGIDVVVLQKNKNIKSSAGIPARSISTSSPKSISSRNSISMRAEDPRSLMEVVSSSSIEQKMYSSSSQHPIETLQVRYKNIPQSSAPSAPSAPSSYSFNNFQTHHQNPSSETGLPWVLLFSQSVIWLVVVGKKMI